MKILMIIFLIGFIAFGGIGLVIRLTHDWNALLVETDKLDENSIAKRDGRAMQLTNREIPSAESVEKSKQRAQKLFRMQTVFSVVSVICLACAILCGVWMQR